MDRSSIFEKLGVGLKFDLKRFGQDARRLNDYHADSNNASTSAQPDAPRLNGLIAAHHVLTKSKKKRKRKASTIVDEDGDETAAKRERTTSLSSEISIGNVENDDGATGIQLLTGVTAGSASVDATSSDGKKKKKKKNKKKKGENAASLALKKEEEMNALRNTLKIHVKGTDVPAPVTSFEELQEKLGLNPVLLRNLSKLEYDKPTPIQMQSIPLMAEG